VDDECGYEFVWSVGLVVSNWFCSKYLSSDPDNTCSNMLSVWGCNSANAEHCNSENHRYHHYAHSMLI